jgi:hypothetical protein
MLEKWLTKLSIESLILSGGNNIGEFPQRDMTEKPYSILLAIISSESKMDKNPFLWIIAMENYPIFLPCN